MAKGETDANAFTDGTSVSGLSVGSSAGALHNSYNATTHGDGNNKKPTVTATPPGYGAALPTPVVDPAEVKGKAPSGVFNAITGAITPAIPFIGKLAGWANGLDPKTQESKVVDGYQTYKNKETGFTYSYNFLGLPYEVKEVNGKLVDALKIDASGKVPGEEGYNKSTNGYAIKAAEAIANGDNDAADKILQEEIENSNTSTGSSSGMELNADNVLAWAKKAGVFASNEDLKAITEDPAGYLKSKGLNLADIVNENGVLIDPEDAKALLDPNNPNYASTLR